MFSGFSIEGEDWAPTFSKELALEQTAQAVPIKSLMTVSLQVNNGQGMF